MERRYYIKKVVLVQSSSICERPLKHKVRTKDLRAYGFEVSALRHLKCYLIKRKQKLNKRVSKTFSEWEMMITGMSDGSILRLLLFDIFLSVLFLFV